MPLLKPKSFRALQRSLPLALALTALVFLNGASWWVYRMTSEEIRENFRANLLATATLLSVQIENAYREDLDNRLTGVERGGIGGEDSIFLSMEEWLALESPSFVPTLASPGSANFQDLYVLDTRGGVIATLTGDLIPNSLAIGPATDDPVWRVHPSLEEDDAATLKAVLGDGRPRTTDEVLRDSLYYLTAYTPISAADRPSGLVGVRANLLFGDRLARLRKQVLFADGLGSLLVALLAAMFYRLWGGLEAVEEKLRQRERLAQLGQMVSVVAHEIRNPLGIIEQTAELLRRRYAKDKKDESLDYISEEVDRLNGIVTRFLDFARPGEVEVAEGPTECDPSDVAREVHRQLGPNAEEKGIALDLNLAGDDGSIPGVRPNAVRQILLNLLFNALDATPRGGKVTLSVRTESNGTRTLAVADTGVGMSAERRKAACDPFFTTKEKGSGLGLALVAKLVDEFSGDLRIESEPDQGTVILITFNT